MKVKLTKLALCIMLASIHAQAAVTYLGVFGGNDDEWSVEAAIFSATNMTVDLTLYDKSDEAPLLTTVTSAADNKSGTWDVLNNNVLISYLTVKASNSFTVYQYSPAQNSGSWTTLGIVNNGGTQPELSHLSLWTVPPSGDPGGEVPEPGTLAIVGGALLGIGYWRRKKTQQA